MATSAGNGNGRIKTAEAIATLTERLSNLMVAQHERDARLVAWQEKTDHTLGDIQHNVETVAHVLNNHIIKSETDRKNMHVTMDTLRHDVDQRVSKASVMMPLRVTHAVALFVAGVAGGIWSAMQIFKGLH